MLRKLFEITWSGIRHGHVYGVRVSRRPVDWIPFVAMLPVAVVGWFLIIVLYTLAMPFAMIWMTFSLRALRRKAGVFSDTGIYFPRAYGRRTVPWSEIREVVLERDPKLICYRIFCDGKVAEPCEYVMPFTQDDDAFEHTLAQRNIPFREHDWRDDTANAP
jgi:hypothetical protein